jgi:hypothetical protein
VPRRDDRAIVVLACGDADLEAVDALMRLELVARRLGYSIHLYDPSGDLIELLDVLGLREVVTGGAG